ncbi:MAG TPA: hypothetical protein PLB91_13775 [Spirochaetales bacterium]|nr:hypothetical protein [Spirochaetales bacterium]HRY54779.1 hypothetical protein [Spirochaetia bacterium]HRZ64313.1 hypothetical protein [Spirochaetia bacterium]
MNYTDPTGLRHEVDTDAEGHRYTSDKDGNIRDDSGRDKDLKEYNKEVERVDKDIKREKREKENEKKLKNPTGYRVVHTSKAEYVYDETGVPAKPINDKEGYPRVSKDYLPDTYPSERIAIDAARKAASDYQDTYGGKSGIYDDAYAVTKKGSSAMDKRGNWYSMEYTDTWSSQEIPR